MLYKFSKGDSKRKHDLFDPRIVSRQGVCDQVNRYMRTVFNEEPLDPSLEVLHDEHSG